MSDLAPTYDERPPATLVREFLPPLLVRYNDEVMASDDPKVKAEAIKIYNDILKSAESRGGTMTHLVIEIVAGAASRVIEAASVPAVEDAKVVERIEQAMDAVDLRPAAQRVPSDLPTFEAGHEEVAVFDLGALVG